MPVNRAIAEGAGAALATRVAIVIPTFRRIDLLTTLLDGLVAQVQEAAATVIVGDNACDPSVAERVAQYSDRISIHYVPVPERGLSQVRNALVAAALRLAPDWQWLLMLDDDGQVTPGWLRRIIACGEAHRADLVGGPVEGVLPHGAGLLARNSVFAHRGRWPTGPVPTLNTTQNLGVSRRLLDRIDVPLFATQLGASGGEDYDLFRRAARAGAKLVWCDEAEVHEPAPADRLTTRALIHRYHSTGIYMASIDAHYDGAARGTLAAIKGVVVSGLRTIAAMLTGRFDASARSFLMIAHYTGRIAGLMGARSARYADEGKPCP